MIGFERAGVFPACACVPGDRTCPARLPRSRWRVSICNHRSAGSGGNARRAECLETNVRRGGLPTMKLVALATGA